MSQHTPTTIGGRSAVIPLLALIGVALLLWIALAPSAPPPAPTPTPAPTATSRPTPTSVALPTFPPQEEKRWDAVASTKAFTARLRIVRHTHRGGGALPIYLELSNSGEELIISDHINIELLDRRTGAVIMWGWRQEPWQSRYIYQGTPVTHTNALLLPIEPGPHYELWASVRYSVGTLSEPELLEIGPLHIVISDEMAGTIRTQINFDDQGWQISATSSDGEHLDGGWAYLRGGNYDHTWIHIPLFDGGAGAWSGDWGNHPPPDLVEVLVAAPDHRAVIDTLERGVQPTSTPMPTPNLVSSSFATLEQAQQHCAFALAQPTQLPAGTTLREVHVLTWPSESPTQPTTQYVTAIYELDNGTQLTFSQNSANPRWELDGAIALEGANGWRGEALKRYGRWNIFWNSESILFTLDTSAPDMPLEQLQQIAESVAQP